MRASLLRQRIGRIWNFTTALRVPRPPSICQRRWGRSRRKRPAPSNRPSGRRCGRPCRARRSPADTARAAPPRPVALQRQQGIGVRAVGQGSVLAESKGVEAIDEVVILEIDGDIAAQFLNRGPGTGCNVQPSGQCRPVVASGPLRTLHFRRSKLAKWPLPASAVQMTPFESTSIPRGV